MADQNYGGARAGAGRPEKVDEIDCKSDLHACLGQFADQLGLIVQNDEQAEAEYHADAEDLQTFLTEAVELSQKHRTQLRGILSRLRKHIRQDESDDQPKHYMIERIRKEHIPRLRRWCLQLSKAESAPPAEPTTASAGGDNA